jgi:hypothetical protein
LRLFSLISAQQAGTSPFLSLCAPSFLLIMFQSRVHRWRTSSLGWVIRRFHTPLWYRRWVGSLSFSLFFFRVLASVYAVEFWSEGRIKWSPLLQQLGCKRGLWEITTPLYCRRRGGTLLLNGEMRMVIVVLTFIHAEFVTDFPLNSQGISSRSFPSNIENVTLLSSVLCKNWATELAFQTRVEKFEIFYFSQKP